MSKKTIYVLAIAVLTLTACKNEKKEPSSTDHSNMEMKNEDGHDHDHSKMESKTSNNKKKIAQNNIKNAATTPIITSYLQIKNALVATDKKATIKAANALLKAFKEFDMSKLSNETHKEYMNILDSAKGQAEHIAKSDIDHQRKHFRMLSEDITEMIALLGTEKTLFQDHCPMANNGKGANWLSEIKDIRNPYFGNKMLHCGSIIKQIN
jgi:hypothetical protein